MRVFEPALVAGVFKEQAGGSLVRFKTCAKAILEFRSRFVVFVCFKRVCEALGRLLLNRWGSDRAEDQGMIHCGPKVVVRRFCVGEIRH